MQKDEIIKAINLLNRYLTDEEIFELVKQLIHDKHEQAYLITYKNNTVTRTAFKTTAQSLVFLLEQAKISILEQTKLNESHAIVKEVYPNTTKP